MIIFLLTLIISNTSHKRNYSWCSQYSCPTNWPLLLWVVSHDTDSLSHWGRVTHICVGKLTIIASDNCLSPGRRQAIIWTNAGTLLIGPLATKFSEILIEIGTISFKKMHLKMSSAKWRPFCLDRYVLKLGLSASRGRGQPAEVWCLPHMESTRRVTAFINSTDQATSCHLNYPGGPT